MVVDKTILKTRGRTINFAAGVYDTVNSILSFGYESKMRAEAIACLDIQPGYRILDAGCGTGRMTLEIAKLLKEPGYIVGIDAAEKMIQVAQSHLAGSGQKMTCRFQAAVAERLPFENESFHLYFSSMFFHHLPMDLKAEAMKEAWRVLRPGGVLVTIDIDRPDNFLAKTVVYAGYLLLIQKAIKENMDGVLPCIMSDAGFIDITQVRKKLGIIAMYRAVKRG
ncbi:MAG: class I SAM-dependent methyltransferase [Anaerohalosphaeraceae bacterium]